MPTRALVLPALLLAGLALPAQADALTGFVSPSRTIGCFYAPATGDQPTSVRCDLRVAEGDPGPKPADCDGDFGQAFRVTGTGRGRRICAGDTTLGQRRPRVLRYGRTARFGVFRCRVTRTRGMTCVNRGGGGFEIARERQRLF